MSTGPATVGRTWIGFGQVAAWIGVFGVIGLIAWIGLSPRADERIYAGSAACASCHKEVSQLHKDSIHQKMMRPAGAPGVTVAQFDLEEPHIAAEEIVWAIGGKWEQQYMGEDSGEETLLPGSWHVGREEWDFRGWDGWERPVPLERCHGCHTVGLDVGTGDFVEPNIGCESCHGPAAWHVNTLGFGQVYSGVESEVCGQCHARGTDLTGQYFFPIGYLPGGSSALDESFNFVTPSPGQDSSHWWGQWTCSKATSRVLGLECGRACELAALSQARLRRALRRCRRRLPRMPLGRLHSCGIPETRLIGSREWDHVRRLSQCSWRVG